MGSPGTHSPITVLYDGGCGFCAWTLAWLLRWDAAGRLRPASIQGSEGAALLRHMAPERRLATWHAVDERGRVYSGGAALTQVLRRLPAGGAFAAVTAGLPRLTERAYATVAINRRRLSRLIPPGAKARARAQVSARSGEADDHAIPTCAI